MKELAEEYRKSAELLRQRMRELRAALKGNLSDAERFNIERRISALTPMLTDCNKMAKLCENYYKKGWYRYEQYTVNGITRTARGTGESLERYNRIGVVPVTARNTEFIPFLRKDNPRNRKTAGREQIDSLPNATQSAEQGKKVCAVSPDKVKSNEEKLLKFLF